MLAQLRAGRIGEAQPQLSRLLSEAPDDAELRHDYALALVRAGQGEAALEQTRPLLSTHPDWHGSHAIHGEALLSVGQYRDALVEFDWILLRRARDPLSLLKRGLALAALGKFRHARKAFDTARAADPGFVEQFCRQLSKDPESAADLDPKSIFLWRRYLAQCACDWHDWKGYVRQFRRAIRDSHARMDRGLAFASLHLSLTAREQQALARSIATNIEQRVPVLPSRIATAKDRLRIGLLSVGFRDHVDALLLMPLIELLDCRRFEVYAYSLGPDDKSAVRDRIRRGASEFRDLSALGSSSAAQQIRRDGIDILVDAAGHSDGSRFEIIAARPAPVQVLYLCYAGTLGSSRVDYAILDSIVAPPRQRAFWSERIVELPDTYFLYDFRSTVPDLPLTRAEYGLPEDGFVLCAFHKGEKIDPDTFSLWAKILRGNARAVLWLLGDRPKVADNLRRAAQDQGIDPARLIFAGREPWDRYMARLRLADLFLDAVHHNAIVTACDSLAVGLPVLTLHGKTCTTLSAESLLRAGGLQDLVADNEKDYVRRAGSLIADPVSLARMRSRIAEARRRNAPLFDTAGRVRQLEAAFTEMWRRKMAGQAPRSFSVVRASASSAGDLGARMDS